MKILMLNYEFPPLGGGAGNATYFLLKQLSNAKHLEIDLITSSTTKYRKKKISENIKVHYLDIGKNKNNLQYQTLKDLLIYSIKVYFYSKKLMRVNNYSFIHAFFGIPCGLIAYFLGLPYIVSLRGADVPFHNQRFLLLDKLFFYHLSKFVWNKAKYVIANSTDLKNHALNTSPRQDIQIIPNGVDTKLFKPNSKINKDHAILFVGRLTEGKGIKTLIKAFSKLPDNIIQSYKVWVVGGGPLRDDLIRLSKSLNVDKRIIFYGIKNKKQLIKIYQKAEFYVLPSRNEGMSNTLLEAMASGLPIICTRTGGVNEIMKNSSNCIVIKNEKELIKSLKLLVNNKALRNKMGLFSRKVALDMSWKDVSEEYMNLYQHFYD